MFTYLALLALLVSSFPFAGLISNFARFFGLVVSPSMLAGLTRFEASTYFVWDKWSFVLIGLVLIVNRSAPQRLNVDAYFIGIFICSGVPFFRFAALEPWGWAAAIVSMAIFVLLVRGHFKFGPTEPSMRPVLALIGILSLLALVLSFTRGNLDSRALWNTNHQFLIDLPYVVMEEVIFRGMLWMLLVDIGLPVLAIIGFQATIFWLAHSHFMFTDPFLFWAFIPVASILLGALVWKTRSLTPSTLAHLAINTFWGLL